jgi:hypothetical protein
MRESDVKQWLIGEVSSFLDSSPLVSLANPSEHVDVADAHNDETYPFVGIQRTSSTPQTAGIGSGNARVDSVNYANSVAESITYRRDVLLQLNVIPVTDGNQALRDDLTNDLSDYFARIGRRNTHPEDIRNVNPRTGSPVDRASDFVRASSVVLEIPYSRYHVDDSITAAEEVNVDIDVEDPDGASSDAFDESF